MGELKPGTLIDLTWSGHVLDDRENGCGGQSVVYLSDFQGKKYALKWYTQ